MSFDEDRMRNQCKLRFDKDISIQIETFFLTWSQPDTNIIFLGGHVWKSYWKDMKKNRMHWKMVALENLPMKIQVMLETGILILDKWKMSRNGSGLRATMTRTQMSMGWPKLLWGKCIALKLSSALAPPTSGWGWPSIPWVTLSRLHHTVFHINAHLWNLSLQLLIIFSTLFTNFSF